MAVKDYSTNPDENTTISGINIAEGCSPSGINNAIRQLMADVRQNADEQDKSIEKASTTVMTGATASAAGTSGNVPAPAAGAQEHVLLGDSSWKKLSEHPDFVELADRVTEAESKTCLPLGHIFTWPFSTPPVGSIIVNGATYSRSLYADLWAYVSSNSGWVKTESEWQSIASANGGFCPYYSDGDGSTTFRVPKFAPYQQIAISAANAGTYHQAGLPEIAFTSAVRQRANSPEPTGALYKSGVTRLCADYGTSQSNTDDGLDFSAAKYNEIYGRSDTVHTEANEWIVCVVAYGSATNVGNADVAAVMQAIGLVQADVATRLPDTTPHIVETWHDEGGSGWYRKWSDGWIEQGGQARSSSNGNATVSLPKEFTSEDYNISTTPFKANTNTAVTDVKVISITTTNFKVYAVYALNGATTTGDMSFYWRAEGK